MSERQRRVLALDCATRTGWATNTSGRVEAGLVTFTPKRGESNGMRYLRFSDWLTEMLTRFRPEVVVYEQPTRFLSATATEVGYGLATRVQEICERHGVVYTPVNPNTLKAWATGRGNAPKDLMQAKAAELYPDYRAAQDPGGDEADARHILAWTLAGMPENEPKPKSRRKKAKPAE